MTAKQKLLDEMVRRDQSGAARRLHDTLLALGFKWKDRAQTIMYFSRTAGGDELGLVAVRPGLVSFPRNFWSRRPSSLKRLMGLFDVRSQIAVEDGPFTSSQYSAGQIALDAGTEAAIAAAIRDIVLPEAVAAGARFRPT